MKPILIFLLLALVAYSVALIQPSKVGDKVTLELSTKKVKAFTRKLANGKSQTWSLSGKNKEVWVDQETGKAHPSTNFVYKATGTLVIKKVKKADAGNYGFIPNNAGPTTTLPPRVHVDPIITRIDLVVFDK
ncbi:unnamed protein product [Caenorhabditis brenneri]